MSFLSPKNRLLILLIILFMFVNTRLVWAGIEPGGSIGCKAIGLISPAHAIKCLLAEYGLDENTIKETTQYAKVANLKKQSPKVTLTFTPTNPTPGEEATATAETIYFSNDNDALYFTWYLQTANCPPNPDLNGDFQKIYPAGEALDLKCNLNKNHDTKDGKSYGIVDMEDYKIKAMRIYANDGYDWETTDYDAPFPDDKDSYKAIQGGEDQKDKNNYCYFYDTILGKEYIFKSCFHLFPNYSTGNGKKTGDESFNKDEEEFWRTNPDDPDTAETGHSDEANVAGLGARSFIWNYQSGDQLGVVVEGTSVSTTPYEDSSYKIMWAVPNNTCGNLEDYIDEDLLGGGDNEEAEVSPAAWPDLPDGGTFTRTLIKKIQTDSEQAPASSYQMRTYKVFTKTEEITLASRRRLNGSATATGTGGTTPTGTATVNLNTTTLDMPNSDDFDCDTFDTYGTPDYTGYSLVETGFVTQAEADSDAKYRVALGVANNSACCYSTMKLEEEDGSETAFCSATTTYSITESTELDIDKEDSIFTMTEDDFNECLLHKNMLTPAEGGGKNEKIEVSLTYSPENPVNDTNTAADTAGDNADLISVVSTIENSTKSESLNYTWTVYAGQYADTDGDWGDPLTKDRLIGVEQTTGAGIPNLEFKANFDETTPDVSGTAMVPKYLKVKLNVSEKVTFGSGTDEEKGTRKGHAEVIIPLSSFNNKLTVKRATVSGTTLVLSPGAEICKTLAAVDKDTLVDAAICQVAPDEIVAAEAGLSLEGDETLATFDFLWTLNGQSLSYKYTANDSNGDPLDNYSAEDFEPGKLIYFPVLATKGSTLNLSLVATSQVSGRKISLTKTFLVSEPTFKITSTDKSTSQPKLLGYYIDLDEKKWPDYSQTEFLAKKNSTIQLALAQFSAFPFPDTEDLSINWYWNDTQLSTTDRSLSFDTTDDMEDSFSLKAEGIYTQDRNTKKALNEYWGVTLDEFYEQLISQQIDFTLADSVDGLTSNQKGQGRILASFISSVPAYFAFLFRLVMTAFVLLAAIWILFALFPQTQKNE